VCNVDFRAILLDMARAKKDPTLEYRSNRLRLEYREEPRWTALAEGEHVGYYRPQSKAAGSWRAKWRDKATGNRKATVLGISDDFEDADGIRILDWAQAQAKARDWFAETAGEARRIADGGSTHEGPLTVGHALDYYKADCERRGLKGLREQNYQVEAHIRPELGSVEVGSLTARQIERWMQQVATSPKRRTAPIRVTSPKAPKPAPKPRNFKVPRPPKEPTPPVPPPLPPSTPEAKRARKDTANRVFAILNAALNLARSSMAFRGEPVWQQVKLYKNTKSARMRFLSIQDQVRLVRACSGDFQRLVKAALHTGARYGELSRIDASAFNREANTLFIPGHLTKNGKSRHIFLTVEGTAFFEAITAGRQASEPLFQRDREVKRSTRDGGQAWLSGDQRPYMESACESASLARLTFHELRHTAASTWIAAGMDLILVARQLGHGDTRMVEKHYGHLCPDAAAARFRSIAPKLGLEGTNQVAQLQIRNS